MLGPATYEKARLPRGTSSLRRSFPRDDRDEERSAETGKKTVMVPTRNATT